MYLYRCVKLWNGLRTALRNCTNIFTSIKMHKTFILDRYKRDILFCDINIFIVLAFGIFMH